MRWTLVTLIAAVTLAQQPAAVPSQLFRKSDRWTASNLDAVSAYRRGDLKTAIKVLTTALDESKEDPTGVRSLVTLHNLAQAYQAQGDYKDALDAYLLLLAREEKSPHSDPLLLVPRLRDLADFYSAFGKPDKSAELLQRVLQIKKDFYGQNSLEVCESRLELLTMYRSFGDAQRETQQLQTLMGELEAARVAQTASVTRVLTKICAMYGAGNLPEQAKSQVSKVIEKLESPTDAPSDARARIVRLSQLVTLKAMLDQPLQGDYQELLQSFDRLDRSGTSASSPSLNSIAWSLTQAGDGFSKRGEFERALSCYERALRAVSRSGESIPLAPWAKNVVYALLYLSRTDDAANVCSQYQLPTSRTLRDAADHLYYLTPNFLHDRHTQVIGERIAKAAMRFAKQEDLSPSEQAKLELSLAQYYHVQNKDDQAERLCRHGIQLQEESSGKNSHALVGMLALLSYTLVGQGKLDQARGELRKAWRIQCLQSNNDPNLSTYLRDSWAHTHPPAGSSISAATAEERAQ